VCESRDILKYFISIFGFKQVLKFFLTTFHQRANIGTLCLKLIAIKIGIVKRINKNPSAIISIDDGFVLPLFEAIVIIENKALTYTTPAKIKVYSQHNYFSSLS